MLECFSFLLDNCWGEGLKNSYQALNNIFQFGQISHHKVIKVLSNILSGFNLDSQLFLAVLNNPMDLRGIFKVYAKDVILTRSRVTPKHNQNNSNNRKTQQQLT